MVPTEEEGVVPTEEEGVVQAFAMVTPQGLYTLEYNQLQEEEEEGVQETNRNSSAELTAGNFSSRIHVQ